MTGVQTCALPILYNNLIYNCTSPGIFLAEWSYDIKIYNNTITGHADGIYNIAFNSVEFYNNIFEAAAWGITCSLDADNNHTLDYNFYQNWVGNNRVSKGPNALNGNAGFVNLSGRDFRLMSNAAAVDSGLIYNSLNLDLEGNTRPYGPDMDMGAYEYNDQQQETPSNTNTNVEPDPSIITNNNTNDQADAYSNAEKDSHNTNVGSDKYKTYISIPDKTFGPEDLYKISIYIQKSYMGNISLVNLQGKAMAGRTDSLSCKKTYSLNELFNNYDFNNVLKGIYYLIAEGSDFREIYIILIY